jgi:hypothetical protein
MTTTCLITIKLLLLGFHQNDPAEGLDNFFEAIYIKSNVIEHMSHTWTVINIIMGWKDTSELRFLWRYLDAWLMFIVTGFACMTTFFAVKTIGDLRTPVNFHHGKRIQHN